MLIDTVMVQLLLCSQYHKHEGKVLQGGSGDDSEPDTCMRGQVSNHSIVTGDFGKRCRFMIMSDCQSTLFLTLSRPLTSIFVCSTTGQPGS